MRSVEDDQCKFQTMSVVAGLEFGDTGGHFFHAAKALVADYEEIAPLRRSSVLRRIDLLVGTVHAHAEYFDQHTATGGDVVDRRFRHLGEMHTVGFARVNSNGLHCSVA